MEQNQIIKKQLLFALRGGNAHKPIKRAITNFPTKFINKKLPNFNHTPWQLLDHLNRAQKDIINFIEDPEYKSPDWPDGFWADSDITVDKELWNSTANDFFAGIDRMEKYIKDNSYDLFSEIPHARQYTIFREVLVLSHHNSYHLGQIMLIRKILKP